MTYFAALLLCFAGFGVLGIFALLTKGRCKGLIKLIALSLGISCIAFHTLADAHGEYAQIGNYVADIVVPRIQHFAHTSLGRFVFNAMSYISAHPFLLFVIGCLIFAIITLLSSKRKKRKWRF